MDKETRKSERQKKEKAVLPVTDPKTLKSAAAYLLKIARSSGGRRRHCKQPKIDALRQCKEEILEAHRHGLAVHRIAHELFKPVWDFYTPGAENFDLSAVAPVGVLAGQHVQAYVDENQRGRN